MDVLREDQIRVVGVVRSSQLGVEIRYWRRRIKGGETHTAVEVRITRTHDELNGSRQTRHETHFLDEALIRLDFLDGTRARWIAERRGRVASPGRDRGPHELRLI